MLAARMELLSTQTPKSAFKKENSFKSNKGKQSLLDKLIASSKGSLKQRGGPHLQNIANRCLKKNEIYSWSLNNLHKNSQKLTTEKRTITKIPALIQTLLIRN